MTIKDHYYDYSLGIWTEGVYLKKQKSTFPDASIYVPTSYSSIYKILSSLTFSKDDIFIDMGCGKGRVICLVATYKIDKVIGVELRKQLFKEALRNSKKMKNKNSKIILYNKDAAKYKFNNETILYMFYPFGIITFDRVIQNFRKSFIKNPRNIKIICGQHQSLLLKNYKWLRCIGQIENTHFFIWTNKKEVK